MRAFCTVAALGLLVALPAHAHGGAAGDGWGPAVAAVGLALVGTAYAVGLARLWGKAGTGRGVSRGQLAAFAAGIALLLAALASPLDRFADLLFSAHMVQHVILVAFAAPALALARPYPAFVAAWPRAWGRGFGRLRNRAWARAGWGMLSHIVTATVLHGAVLWAWHVPRLFEAALHDPLIHITEHATLFASALLFWWVVIGRASAPLAVLALLATMAHMGILAALITFAGAPWYGTYVDAAEALGLSALTDQQAAGLVMWIPTGAVYLLGAILRMAGWLRRLEWRAAPTGPKRP